MVAVPDRSRFEQAYAGKAPWDIGKPQNSFVGAAEQIAGDVLDCGCGTGDLALFLAKRGCRVTGIDFLEEPIARAQAKAAAQGSQAQFLVKDALTLGEWNRRFDVIVDSGLFHVFNDDDRRTYVAGLHQVLKNGGKLFFMCFSDQEPGTLGPRRVTKPEIEQAFQQGWKILSIAPARFEIRPDFTEVAFSAGGARAWFVSVEKPD
jgi:2-polyprenyl-3-methyl-5-hydroxy-6-metoxy-1,4-benzoquinol methylase